VANFAAASVSDQVVARVGLLRGFEFFAGGRVMALPRSAQRVVAFLALQNRPVQRLYVAGSPPLRAPLRRGRLPLAVRDPRSLPVPRRAPVRDPDRREHVEHRLRAGGVDHGHVRRQLELARADLDAGQLPRRQRARALRALLRRRLHARVVDRSGRGLTLDEIPSDLRDRLISLFLVGSDGRRPCFGGVERLQKDPEWSDNILFNEYFHGDNGAGLGASHQTGWTGIVADLILRSRGEHIPTLGELLESGMQTMQ
jgi:hypothetical protein